jgi:hypothetical protein
MKRENANVFLNIIDITCYQYLDVKIYAFKKCATKDLITFYAYHV